MVGCISRLSRMYLSHSLSLSLSFTLLHLHLRKLHQDPSVKLRLDCGFLGNSLDFYVHSPNPSRCVAGFVFSYSTCTPLLVFHSLGDTVTHHRIAHLSFSFCLFIYPCVSCLHSCKWCRDLMLCGSDVFHPSRNTTRINRALIYRYAWSTCVCTWVTLIFRK